MEREELMRQVADGTRKMTIAYYNYMYTDKEYVKGQKLYLREMHVLISVGVNGRRTMSEVAAELDVTQGAISQIASRLLKKDLIRREKDQRDKRFTYLKLTPEGQRVFEEYMEYDRVRRIEVDSYFTDMTIAELQAVLKYEAIARDICLGLLAKGTIRE